MLRSIPLICGLIGLLVAFSFYSWVNRVGSSKKENKSAGEYSVTEIRIIFEKEWLTIIIVVAVLTVAVGICLDWISAAIYFAGVAVALLVEYLAIRMLTRGIYKYGSSNDDESILFKIAFRTGAGAGLFIASLGLLTLGAIFIPFSISTVIKTIACFGFGASTIVLFSDSNFSPSGDLFESYIGSLISVIILSSVALNTSNLLSTFTLNTVAIYPLIIAGIGIVASVIGMLFVKVGEKGKIATRINVASYVSAIIISAVAVFISINLLQSYSYSIAIIIGIVSGLLSGATSVKRLSFVPGLIFAIAFVVSYSFAGPYGVALTSVGFVSMTSILVAINSFGVVTDTNGITNKLSNGYSACASALTVLALFVAFTSVAEVNSISITDPLVLASMLVGVMMPLIYATIYTRALENEVNYDFVIKLLAIFIPGVIGIFLGCEALGGLLGGLITTGLITSFVLNNVGNTVSDKYSNSLNTSINTLIKYMTIFSVVFAPVFLKFGSFFF